MANLLDTAIKKRSLAAKKATHKISLHNFFEIATRNKTMSQRFVFEHWALVLCVPLSPCGPMNDLVVV